MSLYLFALSSALGAAVAGQAASNHETTPTLSADRFDQAQSPNVSAMREYQMLAAGYARASRDSRRNRGPRGQRDAAAQQTDPIQEYGEKFLALAERHPRSAAALRSLVWTFRLGYRQPDLARRAADVFEADFLRAPDIHEALAALSSVNSPSVDPRQLLRSVIEINSNRSARGAACYFLARRMLADERRNSIGEEKHEAVVLLERVVREFGDVRFRDAPLANLARLELFDLRKVRPGAVDGPPVQMFSPGFGVRELPVELENINNARYRADGKLLLVGYSGRIFLLSDTDGDGVEDDVKIFWDQGGLRAPVGAALTPPGYHLGNGLFVASKGKVSLIVDTDGDDVGDREHIVASGWEEIDYVVDTVGAALDGAGNLYFGLGCANFENPYQIDSDTNKAHYDPGSERGAVLKVSPDFKSREIVCTGVRFPVGMAFNRHGDLFCTDQEGEAWLRGANPLDEFLWIAPGRHYGFPPRHEVHLPNVVDEPALVQFGPQHQVTCGLCFNEAAEGGRHFGPEHWRGDAFIAGYVRGKIYRTKSVKTPHGYVAANSQIAAVGMLTVDVAVSPDGGMLVVCHGGKPSWGSGPSGSGKLFKISYDPAAPQPVGAWAHGPMETRIAFDRPIDSTMLDNLADRISIEYGQHVRAGERYEVLMPAYREILDQRAASRHRLPILDVELADDGQTLRCRTLAHPEQAWYAVRIDGVLADSADDQGEPFDLDYTLSGVDAEWLPNKGQGRAAWTGWLPHFDLGAAKSLLAGTAARERLVDSLQHEGRLRLQSKIKFPPGRVTLAVESSTPIAAQFGNNTADSKREFARVILQADSTGEALPLIVSVATGASSSGAPELHVSYRTDGDPTERTLPTQMLTLPWAPAHEPTTDSKPLPTVDLPPGEWERGKSVFENEGRCSACHRIRGAGNSVGPDLSELIHRDLQSVRRDIEDPSAAINAAYSTYVLALSDGRVVSGVLQADDGDQMRLTGADGKQFRLSRQDIEQYKPSATSTMPTGLLDQLSPQQVDDLMTFLLTAPPNAMQHPR